jgi:hypothetical protein
MIKHKIWGIERTNRDICLTNRDACIFHVSAIDNSAVARRTTDRSQQRFRETARVEPTRNG